MTVTLLRDPFAAAPGPAVAALVFCGEDDAGDEGEGQREEMEHDGGGGGSSKNKPAVAALALSHAGLAAPGDTIPGAESDADEGGGGGGLLRGHGTRAGGVDLVAAATAAAAPTTTATAAAGGDVRGGAPPTSASASANNSSGLFATVAGQVSRVDRLVRVAPALPGARYSADVGDVVVGRVAEVSGKRWRVDLGGKHDAALALSAVSLPAAGYDDGGGIGGDEDQQQFGEEAAHASSPAFSAAVAAVARRRGAEDEASMREVLAEGDLLSAEVQAVHSSDGSVLLHARSSKYGRLGGGGGAGGGAPGGRLVRLPASSVGRQRQQFNDLHSCGVSVILGVNGWVWVSPLAGGRQRQQQKEEGQKQQQAAAADQASLDGRRAVAVASAALRALSALGIAVTPRSIERAVGVAAAGNFAPSADLEEEYLLAVARAERGASGWSVLTSKLGPVGFYKGRQVEAAGRLTRKGAFEVLEHRRPRYRLPEGLESSELRPYVARDPSFAAAAKKAG